MRSKLELDMLHGSLWDKILLYALPLAATGILQQLFNAADVAVVGRYVGKDAMAAVGSNGPVIGLLVNLFVGISLGANIVIASATGQENSEDVRKSVHTSIMIALIGGIFAAILGECGAYPMLRRMSVPDEVFPMALLYLRIYLSGMPVILLYNFESAIFRSRGDTKTPLAALVISGIINVALNLFFVRVLHRTSDGVAMATVISNIVSSGLLFLILLRSDSDVAIRIQELSINGRILKKILLIGIPSGVQGMVFSLANIMIQSAINSLDTTIMAASSAAFNLEIFSYYILNSFGQACATFVGQNHGAGQERRCGQTLRTCLILDFGATAMVCMLLLTFGRMLLSIFNGDPDVIHYGYIRLMYLCLAHAFSLVIEVVSGYLRGYGVSFLPAAMTMGGICGVRIAWVYTLFRVHPTFETLMQVYPLSLFVTAVLVCISALVYHRITSISGQ